MEIPAWLFFSFWALISITFLHLGFYTLDKTELSYSVSPVIMSFFKHSLAISSCCSSNYALIFRPQLKYEVDRRYFYVFFGTLPLMFFKDLDETAAYGVLLFLLIRFSAWLLHFLPKLKIFSERYSLITALLFIPTSWYPWYFPIFTLMNFILIVYLATEVKTRIGIHMVVETSLFFVNGENTVFFPLLVLFVSFLISAFGTALSGFEPYTCVSGDPLSGDESFKELLPVAEKVKEFFLMLKGKKIGKMIGFAVGMMGTVLFQYFFRLTSFNHVVAFLFLTVAWVANLAMLGVSNDFGVFNFLLGNVVVGCTVSQFGLRSTTWFAYGACLLLYGLRLKLESLTLQYGPLMEIPTWFFSSFGALGSITFLHLGFYALDRTELSNSVSPVVMSFFKHSLTISSCCSSNYALIFRPQWRYYVDERYFLIAFGVLPVLISSTISHTAETYTILLCLLSYASIDFLPDTKIFTHRFFLFRTIIFLPGVWFPWYLLIFASINFIHIDGGYRLNPAQKRRIGIHMAVATSLFFVSGENTKFFPILVLFLSFFISAFRAALSGFKPWTRVSRDSSSLWVESFKELLPVAEKVKEIFLMLKERKMGKLIGFAVGMGSTVLFQHFFRITSFNQVVAFLYLAVMWVANLALLGVSDDLGVLNFVLVNVVVGCTVSQFGLQSTTWLAYGASLLLFGLRLKLESLTLLYGRHEHIHFRLWFEPYRLPI